MKNADLEEPPLNYINRSPLWLAVFVFISVVLAACNTLLFLAVSGLALLFLIPTVLLAFHTLWMLLNPFAGIYKDKFEVKPSLFSQKIRYFIDIKNAGLSKKGHLILEYLDGDTELISLHGIHKKQTSDLLKAIHTGKTS